MNDACAHKKLVQLMLVISCEKRFLEMLQKRSVV